MNLRIHGLLARQNGWLTFRPRKKDGASKSMRRPKTAMAAMPDAGA
jgi:hypothetical protein